MCTASKRARKTYATTKGVRGGQYSGNTALRERVSEGFSSSFRPVRAGIWRGVSGGVAEPLREENARQRAAGA